jgi:hypothetical protein
MLPLFATRHFLSSRRISPKIASASFSTFGSFMANSFGETSRQADGICPKMGINAKQLQLIKIMGVIKQRSCTD